MAERGCFSPSLDTDSISDDVSRCVLPRFDNIPMVHPPQDFNDHPFTEGDLPEALLRLQQQCGEALDKYAVHPLHDAFE